ncbi:MAG TPA: trypsin-like peptidase domain-containing protein, partial [Acidobacteriota bacterium]
MKRNVVIGTVVGLIAGLLFARWLLEHKKGGGIRDLSPRVGAVAEETPLLPEERNTIDVFENAAKSVVFITSKALQYDFFSMNVFETPQGAGSGFLWDEEGHVVTNFHVIAGANALTVTLSDHSSYEAAVVGGEPNKDLAVLRIKAPSGKLIPVRIGTSDKLLVGQKVLAIGNPFGLDQTLTVGIVSALGRQIQSVTDRKIQDVIQTDAAINPGNSGGPLLDSNGSLIGVNTAIVSPSGAYAGIGFAVPVNTVKRVVPQLIRFGKVIRPGLGVGIVSDSVAQRLGIEGVIIGQVRPGSSAAEAGLRGIQRSWGGEIT